MYRHVWAKDFWAKEVYLGVRLGQRGMRVQLSGGVFAQFISLYQRSEKALGLDDEAVDDGEIAKWTEQAERLGRALAASALGARHASSDEIAWLFRHTLSGSIGDPPPSATPPPYLGRGRDRRPARRSGAQRADLTATGAAGGESFAAFLSFSRFPDVMAFPDGEPWLHFADSLPFPVEISSRMKLIPPAKASKDVSHKLAHARDMDIHIREAGAEAPIALAEQLEAARMLEHGITKERLPFVYGWHRLIITAPTREMCVRRVEAVIEHYRDIGHRHRQLHRRPVLAAVRVAARRSDKAQRIRAAPAALHDRGRGADRDRRPRRPGGGRAWIGPYIGETLGRARSVVHFDPLAAAARNRPTAIAITGEPGGGKTTLALLLIYQLALRGVTVAVIDPKGDAESLVRPAADAWPPGPGTAARLGGARPARPVLVRGRPGGQADDGHRDAAAAAAADERGA